MKERLILSTDSVDPIERNDYWREIIQPICDTRLLGDAAAGGLEGSFDIRMLGSHTIVQARYNGQLFCRSQHLIRKSGLEDFYYLNVFLSGSTHADCAGQTISIGPGDIAVSDLGLASTWSCEGGSHVSLLLPRGPIDRVLAGKTLHGTVLKSGSPIGRLLSDFVVSISRLPLGIRDIDALELEDIVASTLAASLKHRAYEAFTDNKAQRQLLRRRILQFIDENLSSAHLDISLLSEKFRISRAHLYRAFADDGGVTALVRDRRLQAAFRELTHPGSSGRSISEIAYKLGFSNSNQFLRAFRARFGMTPTEARHEGFLIQDRHSEDLYQHFVGLVR